MIYCPKCGTANRDGSRFCNECGERLGTQTRLRCPECGTYNSLQSVFCSECGVSLLSTPTPSPGAEAAPTIKGLSLPTKASMDDSEGDMDNAGVGGAEDDIPAWLQEMGSVLPGEGTGPEPVSDEDAAEVPDWLRDLRASLPEEPEAEVPQDDALDKEEMPDWLATLRQATPEADAESQPERPEPGREEEEMSDWLAEPRPATPEAEVEAEPEPHEPESEEGEMPDWLADFRPATPETEVEAEPELLEPEPEEEEMPGWLADFRPETPEAEAEAEPEPPEPEPEEEEMPDWLADFRPATPEAEAEAEPEPEPELEESEVPDWLAEIRPTTPEGEAEAESEPEPELEEGKVPDWLAELEPTTAEGEPELVPPWSEAGADVEPPAEEEESIPPSDEELPLAPAAMPTWLAELQQDLPPEDTSPDGEELVEAELPDWLVRVEESATEADEILVRAEIPEWLLALKPRELRAEEGEQVEGLEPLVEEVVEDTGLLAGLHGTLPVEMLIAQPRAAVAEEVEAPVADTPQARLFAEIVSRPPEVAPKPLVEPSRREGAILPHWIIYLALIVVVTVPLLLGKPLLPRTAGSSPAVESLRAEMQSQDSEARVLVAFDYDPTTSGEMDVLAKALIGHLMDQEAQMAVVSLLPSGPATAQILLDEMVKAHPSYADNYGQRYAILGYLPGQAAAARLLGGSLETAFAQDFQGNPVSDLELMAGVTAIQDFDLILVLAAGQDTLRWWIEQAGTPYDVPLAAGVSASIEPLARPYYEAESRQLVGLAGGVPGAAVYEALGNDQGQFEDATAASLDSLLAGHLIFILVLVVGNGVYLVRRGNGRGR